MIFIYELSSLYVKPIQMTLLTTQRSLLRQVTLFDLNRVHCPKQVITHSTTYAVL